MVAKDTVHFFRTLEMYPCIRVLLAAGAITNRYYIIEFLEKYSYQRMRFVRTLRSFERRPDVHAGVYEVEVAGSPRLL